MSSVGHSYVALPWTVLLYFVLNEKLVNLKTFESLNIIKCWSCQAKKRENQYDLKEMEDRKNTKIVSIAWHHNVLTEMFTITEKSTLLYEKVEFLTIPTQVAIIVCCYFFADK